MHFISSLQRGELEMYIDVAKCISEMADSEINRIVQISKVIVFNYALLSPDHVKQAAL